MSMITEQVDELREEADFIRETIENDYPVTLRQSDLFKNAADTIEQLAAKVRKENKTEEAIALERYEDLCIFFHNDKDVLNNRKEFIDWLERMKWHVKMADELFRENEAYQKAFEDIRAEFIRWIEMDGGSYEYDKALKRGLNIVDKYDPAKMNKEGEE